MKLLLAIVVLALSGASQVFTLHTATGGNMEPTIKTGDTLQADNSYYFNHKVERFDIVLTNCPDESAFNAPPKDTKFISRVIGLGGDRLKIKAGKVFINGKRLKEPFKTIPPDEDFGPVDIASGEYFLMGDNRTNSWDSRFWRPATVKMSHIKAKIVKVVKLKLRSNRAVTKSDSAAENEL